MFGIGPLEMVVILALALIVLGPQKFPEAGRAFGKAMREFRSMTTDISRDLNSSFDDSPPPRRVPTNTVEHKDSEPSDNGVATATSPDETAAAKQPDENEPGPV